MSLAVFHRIIWRYSVGKSGMFGRIGVVALLLMLAASAFAAKLGRHSGEGGSHTASISAYHAPGETAVLDHACSASCPCYDWQASNQSASEPGAEPTISRVIYMRFLIGARSRAIPPPKRPPREFLRVADVGSSPASRASRSIAAIERHHRAAGFV